MDLKDGNILVVDDDRDILETARLFLKQKFRKVSTLESPDRIDAFLDENEADVILLDMNFGTGEWDGATGKEWLQKIRLKSPFTTIIVITAYRDVNLAVETMKMGATDFIVKPWNNDKLYSTIMSALELKNSKLEITRLREVNKKVAKEIEYSYSELIGRSPVMKHMLGLVEKVASTDANILILGENGTGKELVARAIHRLSLRNNEVFIRVDLGALTGTLFESELFGHVKGAFTDAISDHTGSFELAHGGTIFLDEIGNISMPLQTKLLTAIQNREIRKVGSNKIIPVDFRLICASNMDLQKMAEKDRPEFRKDLLYRINTVEIRVPPLRERAEDIRLLTKYYLGIYRKKYNKPYIKPDASQIKKMMAYKWPGNVRELQHTIEKAVILSDGKIFPESVFYPDQSAGRRIQDEPKTLEEMEKQMIEESIQYNQGNLSRVAAGLGITRATLYRKMEKYGL